jgi:hypothetical protein
MDRTAFEEITGRLAALLGNIEERTSEAMRLAGGDHLHGSRLGAVAFWYGSLASADLDAKQRSALQDLGVQFTLAAGTAGVTVGAAVPLEVIELDFLGGRLSPAARSWALGVMRSRMARDAFGEELDRMQRRREAAEALALASALEAQHRSLNEIPSKVEALREHARALRAST